MWRRYEEGGSAKVTEGLEMGDSKAYEKLKKEYVDWTAREEWEFRVFTKPPGLVIDHFGDKLVLSAAEVKDLVTGKATFARYPAIPKYMYRTIMVKAAEALGVVYRPYMVEAATPERVVKPRFELPKPKPWEVAEKKASELKERIERYKDEIARLEAFLKAVREMEKK